MITEKEADKLKRRISTLELFISRAICGKCTYTWNRFISRTCNTCAVNWILKRGEVQGGIDGRVVHMKRKPKLMYYKEHTKGIRI